MDPAPARKASRVEWVSYAFDEARSQLPFMKAIPRRVKIGCWHLRPVVQCIEPKRPGWLMARGMPRGIGGHGEEFELSEEYPWFIE